jgi:hypothetical protein
MKYSTWKVENRLKKTTHTKQKQDPGTCYLWLLQHNINMCLKKYNVNKNLKAGIWGNEKTRDRLERKYLQSDISDKGMSSKDLLKHKNKKMNNPTYKVGKIHLNKHVQMANMKRCSHACHQENAELQHWEDQNPKHCHQ